MKSALSEILLQSLANFPESRIIEAKGAVFSYQELEKEVAFWTAFLAKKNPVHFPVALIADKSLSSFAAYLAVLCSNCTLVPIDPNQPQSRIADILQNAKPGLVISELELENQKGSTAEKGLFCYQPTAPQACEVPLVLHTSGSSGIPKGVLITMEALQTFTDWAIQTFALNSKDTLACYAGYHFDLSTFDLLAGIKSGANLWLINHQLGSNFRLLGEQWQGVQPTVLYATPTVISALLEHGKPGSENAPRWILFAGEVFPIQLLNNVRAYWNTMYSNLYGPTETNVVTYFHLPKNIESNRETPYPIGVVCPYATIELRDDGEICVAGATVSPGYLNFPPHSESFYKTGDLAEFDASQNLIFKGRSDEMIKHKGIRIEPGEIACRLGRIENIMILKVLLLEGALVACYTGEQIAEFKLKIAASKLLPITMIPSRFVYIREVPLGPTGKLDIKHLLTKLHND